MKKALGKGLSALIPDSYSPKPKEKKEPEQTSAPRVHAAPAEEAPSQSGFRLVSIADVMPNQDQPRKDFSPEGIEELAASIREKGILQPIIVKEVTSGKYQIVCGERRFRASTLCGLSEIPVIVKDIADQNLLEWALIENIQREDLNPLEEAQAYWRLADERGLGQEEIAKRVGKDRSTIANMIRLLRLPEEVRNLIAIGRLTTGHARALLGLMTPEHQRQMAKRIAEENLSVRQVELIVNRSNAHKRKAKKARPLSPEIVDLESKLAKAFGTQVKVVARKDGKQGRIEIHYFSLDELDRILEKAGLEER